MHRHVKYLTLRVSCQNPVLQDAPNTIIFKNAFPYLRYGLIGGSGYFYQRIIYFFYFSVHWVVYCHQSNAVVGQTFLPNPGIRCGNSDSKACILFTPIL